MLPKINPGLQSPSVDSNGADLAHLSSISFVMSFFSSLHLCEVHLFPKICEASGNYYTELSEKHFASNDMGNYLELTHSFLSKETGILSSFLDVKMQEQLMSSCLNIFVTQRLNSFFEHGFQPLMEARDFGSLALFYKFLFETKNIATLSSRLSSLIKIQIASPWKIIPDLIKAISLVDDIVKSCFDNDPQISNALKGALSASINSSKKLVSFLLVRYLSAIIEANHSEFPLASTEYENAVHQIDKALYIFRLIQGKQDFEIFYKAQLARRLLLGFMFLESDCSNVSPLNIPLEKYTIFKLKGECGLSFTFKLEGMLRDISCSLKYKKIIKNRMSPASSSPLKMSDIPTSLSILTPNFWPAIGDSKMNARILRHPVFESAIGAFSNGYREANKGRHLKFSLKNSTCIVEVTCPHGKTFSLLCSAYQAIVLEAFSSESLSFSRLEKISGLTKNDLTLVLESLIQKEIILQSSDTFFMEDACFSVNPNVNQAGQEFVNILTGIYSKYDEFVDQNPFTPMDSLESFSPENLYQIDAAIVRILKHQKTLPQSLLFKAALDSIKFPVEVRYIISSNFRMNICSQESKSC
ncbi:cullin 4 [Mitosporidium daphniae]|uniref:Cullin 4 n=1 Tax=Mitosporidium daphniae TaxID=1485682 RepID=A0A098VRH8_9MICR|nr:cullin 4 [Mitosporidium daphniae]KGG51637.1 cullin 4 [Mitosporidium daphniae]|eukprot:XP_013238064.1 cullin 4 [Mitosporidium daphniae]